MWDKKGSSKKNVRPSGAYNDWTDERVGLLKRLWKDGLSTSQIAAELGGVTRNAVIGKAHRLGLSGSGQPTLSVKCKPRQSRVVRIKTVAPGSELTEKALTRTGRPARTNQYAEGTAMVPSVSLPKNLGKSPFLTERERRERGCTDNDHGAFPVPADVGLTTEDMRAIEHMLYEPRAA